MVKYNLSIVLLTSYPLTPFGTFDYEKKGQHGRLFILIFLPKKDIYHFHFQNQESKFHRGFVQHREF